MGLFSWMGSQPFGLTLGLVLALLTGKSLAITADDVDDAFATTYLEAYGYYGDSVPDPALAELKESDPDMARRMGIMMFQAKYEAYGLNMTGELDEPTRELMAKPRCGMMDMMIMEDMPGMDMDEMMGDGLRKRRYATVGSGWARNDLTYNIVQYTPDLPRSVVDSDIERALQVWADVTPLTFTRSSSLDADILIYFIRGNAHFQLDGSSFDGPSGVLAHAYFPFNSQPIEGDAHFDEDEPWTSGTFQGINLFQVAAHEFGHSLGLSHSEIDAALMAPFYTGYQPNFELHFDDVAGIQALYGEPGTGTGGGGDGDGMGGPDSTTRQPNTPPPGMPDFCAYPKLDAMTAHWEGGELRNYAFQGEFYARLDSSSGILPGYPRRISGDWEGVTGSIDAALYLPALDNLPPYTLLFKGARYYVFSDDRTPVPVRDNTLGRFDLPEDMEGIDAAFVWGRNGRVYVMKDNQYYRLKRRTRDNVNRLLKMNNGYPADIGVWNLPVDSIDGAHMWFGNGRTYFFKDHQYYRYDDANVQIDQEADPAYPRDIGAWWLGCNNNYVAGSNQDDSSGVATERASMAAVAMAALLLLVRALFH